MKLVNNYNYHTYEELLSLIKKSDKNYNLTTIQEAYNLAKKAHEGQKRVSGVEYIFHPISVAYILVKLGMDTECIVAALLHDVVEDTYVKKEDIKQLFGNEICNLVDGVTKLRKIPSRTAEEQQAENVRKMLLAMSKDIRVIMIKLADRLQNMRTIECMPPQKRRDKSLQNMEVFAPIAHRLGIRTIKDELEDISLKCLDPIAYTEVEDSIALCKADREKFIDNIKKKIMNRVKNYVPDVYIEGRVKSANEIYKKMFIKGKSIEQIYDVYAVRIIVNTIGECYNIFGIIHDIFQPIPSRFKDYISTPKPNMYQSLHTTVMSKEGIPFEVQIRTWKMHKTAEYGIAAHWKYKLERLEGSKFFGKSLGWVKKLLDNYKNIEDVTDVVGSIKSDLVPKEIFVLTPKGGVITLPVGSNVIDFAYAVHTELGNKMIGAKVNKKIVPIDYVLKTGEIAEIIATKDISKGPNRDWISIVKTSEARNKIRQWFKRECREENIKEGKEKFESELLKHNIKASNKVINEVLEPILYKKQFKNLEDFYAAIGYGGIQLWKIMPRIKKSISEEQSNYKKNSSFENSKSSNTNSNAIIVEGIKNCSFRFAKCCLPLPNDEIVGFITKGHGVSIHKKSCRNIILEMQKRSDRILSAKWDKGKLNQIFEVSFDILAYYSEDFLSNLTCKISSMDTKMISLNSKVTKDDKINVKISLTIKNMNYLKLIVDNLNKIDGIIYVKRS